MRFRVMGRYFDAFRIDHVLGWFRIWEIPGECVKGNGRLGHFYPATPIHWVDLQRMNLSSHWDRKRLCEPWNPPSIVGTVKYEGGIVAQEDLDKLAKLGVLRFEANLWQFNMKESDADLLLQDQLKQALIDVKDYDKLIAVVIALNANRCLTYDRTSPQFDCHPIFCNMVETSETYSFKCLSEWDKNILRRLGHGYFYEWHQDVWAQSSSTRLPIIGKASDMLIVGEDLGLLAPIVPKKMEEFGLLGLRVQRMPADPKIDFWRTEDYSWMTVCSPATHDSPPLRLWLEDKVIAKKYWNQ